MTEPGGVRRPHGSPLSPPMLTYAQVGALLGRSVSTVEKWVKNHNIPFHRIGRNVRFDPTEIRQWLEENEITSDNRIRPTRPLKKRPGAQYVFPSDTLGDEEHCWCGELLDHDWAGKDRGAPHPHEHEGIQQVVIVDAEARRNRIEKTDLRGYHATLKSFIIRCVNTDGLAWRGQKNAVLLYPPDDTQPVTVYCRNNDSQMRSLKQWYAAHVQPSKEVTDEQVVRLAEEVNDPVEHPFREPEPPGGYVDEYPKGPEPVTPYITTEGEESEFFLTDGKMIWCKVCEDTPTDYRTPVTAVTGLGGHIRMRHRDTSNMRTPEALAKSVDSRRYNRLHDKVVVAVELLAETVGLTPDNSKIAEYERDIARLQHELEKQTKRADDAETRIKLMQEAFRGLE